MGLSSARVRIRKMFTPLNRAARREQARLRRWTAAADVWLQDHHVPVAITMFILLGAGAGLLLWMDGNTVIAYAKAIAPVLTVTSIVAGAILSTIKRFRKRRAARLAHSTADSITTPSQRSTESGSVTADNAIREENR